MAKEQAFQFIIHAKEDQALQSRLQAVKDGGAGVVKIGKELGFDFTEKEMRAVVDEQQEQESSELSEEALETIAAGGGKTPPTKPDHESHVVIAIIAILIG